MIRYLPLTIAASLTACTVPEPAQVASGRPLETLPAGARLADVEADLLATARERFGAAAVDRALSSPIHLIAKRFAGMAPPPPPGAGAGWRPPTPSVLLYKESGTWWVATAGGWRQARAAASGELDLILGDRAFWSDPATVPACPDFGASNLLIKFPERARVVRSHQCISATSRAVGEALQA